MRYIWQDALLEALRTLFRSRWCSRNQWHVLIDLDAKNMSEQFASSLAVSACAAIQANRP